MNIIFSDERLPGQKVIDHMTEAAKLCVEQEGLDPKKVEISVTFVSSEEIKELNKLYRQKNVVTDVLSFPQYDNLSEIKAETIICLGDVVICSEVALIQAEEYGHSAERELVYLLVHSIFHLLGYDHIEAGEKLEMREQEEKIMNKINLGKNGGVS
jgi:probable rRNA maturation factor